jgi:DNA-binding MarR family transcriptional regulator
VLLDDNNRDGMLAETIGSMLGASGSQVGAWLRDLRCHGWVYKVPVSPSSCIVRWHLTEAGRAYLDEPVESAAS